MMANKGKARPRQKADRESQCKPDCGETLADSIEVVEGRDETTTAFNARDRLEKDITAGWLGATIVEPPDQRLSPLSDYS